MTPAGQTCRSLSKTHRWDGTSLPVGNPRRQPSDTNVLRLVAIQATSARPTTREPSISDVPPLAMGFEKASFKIERAFNNPILLLPRQWSGRAMSGVSLRSNRRSQAALRLLASTGHDCQLHECIAVVGCARIGGLTCRPGPVPR